MHKFAVQNKNAAYRYAHFHACSRTLVLLGYVFSNQFQRKDITTKNYDDNTNCRIKGAINQRALGQTRRTPGIGDDTVRNYPEDF